MVVTGSTDFLYIHIFLFQNCVHCAAFTKQLCGAQITGRLNHFKSKRTTVKEIIMFVYYMLRALNNVFPVVVFVFFLSAAHEKRPA